MAAAVPRFLRHIIIRCWPTTGGQTRRARSAGCGRPRRPPSQVLAASSRHPRPRSGGLWRPGRGQAMPGSSGDPRPSGEASWRANAGRRAGIWACPPSSTWWTRPGPPHAARCVSRRNASGGRCGSRRRRAPVDDGVAAFTQQGRQRSHQILRHGNDAVSTPLAVKKHLPTAPLQLKVIALTPVASDTRAPVRAKKRKKARSRRPRGVV